MRKEVFRWISKQWGLTNMVNKYIQILFQFCLLGLLSACSPNIIQTNQSGICISGFTEFAYDLDKRKGIYTDLSNSGFVSINPKWTKEEPITDSLKSEGIKYSFSGERIIQGSTELWIRASHGSYNNNENLLFDSRFGIYNPTDQKWTIVDARVKNCDCVADVLFFDKNGNIWAKNAGNLTDDKVDEMPVLSKYNEIRKVFEPVEETRQIYTGTISEISRKIYYSNIIYDEKETIWIISGSGDIFSFNVIDGTITDEKIFTNLDIISVAYDRLNNYLYILNQRSYKLNLLRIPSDFEVIRYDPERKEFIRRMDHPYYWPNNANLWIDQFEDIWFDSIGYLDKNSNWHLLIPNMETYIFINYFDRNITYQNRKIIAETQDGKLWFIAGRDLAWYDSQTNSGCWDSTSVLDIFEDSDQKLWLLTNSDIYSRVD